MSYSSKGILNSEFFMKKNTNEINEKFYTKDEVNNVNYKYIGGERDVYEVINSNNEVFEFERKTFQEQVQYLKNIANKRIDHLSNIELDTYKKIEELVKQLKNNKTIYSFIISDINQIFLSVKNLEPETVGSRFIGCYNNDNFKGNKECNPKCMSSLLNYNQCKNLVLFIDNNIISSLNDIHSDFAQIHVKDKNFKFSQKNIDDLKSANIKEVEVFTLDAHKKFVEVMKRTSIDQVKPNSNLTTKQTTSVNNISVWVWVVIGVVILFLILLGIWAIFAKGKGNNKSAKSATKQKGPIVEFEKTSQPDGPPPQSNGPPPQQVQKTPQQIQETPQVQKTPQQVPKGYVEVNREDVPFIKLKNPNK